MKKYIVVATLCATSFALWGDTFTWKGGDGPYFDNTMWTEGAMPAASQGNGATITIANGNCDYVPGGDWNPKCSVVIGEGGRWFQSAGAAWIQNQGSILVKDGGILDTGTSERFRNASGSTITVENGGKILLRKNGNVAQGGIVNLNAGGEIALWNGNAYNCADGGWRLVFNGGAVKAYDNDGNPANYADAQTYSDYAAYAIAYTSGSVEKFGRFVFSRNFTLNGATIDVGCLQSTGAYTVTLAAGTLKLSATASSDGYETQGGMINFPLDSTAALVIRNATVDEVATKFFAANKVAIGGTKVAAADMSSNFDIASGDGSVTLTKKAVEGLPAFANNGAVTVTEGSPRLVPDMIVTATVADVGESETTATLVYGTANGGGVSESNWQHAVDLGTVMAGQVISQSIPQTANEELYYNIVLKNAAGSVWGKPKPEFVANLKVWTWNNLEGESKFAKEGNWTPGGYPWTQEGARAQILSGTVLWDSGDWGWNGYMYIENAKLYQESGSWQNIGVNGYLELGSGGIYDGGPSDSFRMAGHVIIRNGGELIINKNMNNGGVIRVEEGGTATFKANVRSYSGDTATRPTFDNAGTIDVAGTFFALKADVFTNGVVRANEFRVQNGNAVAFNGTAFAVTKLAVNDALAVNGGTVLVNEYIGDDNGGHVISLAGGSIELAVAGTHAENGYLRNNDSGYIDFVADSEGALVLGGGFDAAGVYSAYFSGTAPKCRFGGLAITEEQFARNFTVTTDEETEKVTVRYQAAVDVPTFANGGAMAVAQNVDGVSLNVTGEVNNAGNPAATLYLVWGTTDGGLESSAWAHKVTVRESVEDGEAIDFDFTPDAATPVYWNVYLDNGVDTVWATPSMRYVIAGAKLFVGASGSSASDASCWYPAGVPGAGDTVVVDGAGSLNWNAAAIPTVAKLVKNGSGTLVVQSTLAAPFVVTGDLDVLAGDVSAVKDPTNPNPYPLVLSVGGNLTIAAGAKVHANTCGVWHGGPFYTANKTGAAFAGEGGYRDPEVAAATSYGSVLDPLTVGTSVQGDNNSYRAGGVVKIVVAGALANNGTISANGFGWPGIWGGSSGGSVNVTAGSLSGAGVIEANGGRDYDIGCGSGGRVKVALTGTDATFDAYEGQVTAYCHNVNMVEWRHLGAAGTVCLQTEKQAAAGTASVIVDNEGGASGTLQPGTEADPYRDVVPSTHLPAIHACNPVNDGNGSFTFPTDEDGGELKENLSKTDWIVKGAYTKLKITEACKINSLTVVDNAKIDLNGRVLRVKRLVVDGVKFSLPATSETCDALLGEGQVIGTQGLSIFIR